MATGDPFPWELRPDGLWGFVVSDSSNGFGLFEQELPLFWPPGIRFE